MLRGIKGMTNVVRIGRIHRYGLNIRTIHTTHTIQRMIPKSLTSINMIPGRYFSNESLRDTVNKIKDEHEKKAAQEEEGNANASDGNNAENANSSKGPNPAEAMGNVADKFRGAMDWMRDNFQQAWDEMTGKAKVSSLERRVHQAESFRKPKESTGEGADEDEIPAYDGPSALVVVKDPVSAWERMKDRLKDSPLIKEMLKGTKRIGAAAADTDLGKQAQKVGQGIKDKLEDAREVWETSQNPLIYTLSGVWENFTSSTEEGIAIAQLRKLDPNFVKEEWLEEVRHKLTPTIIKSHLEGNIKALKPWCGEAVFNKLSADIRARRQDGITFDSNILDIEEAMCLVKQLEDGEVAIVVVYLVQQINCIRNSKGEVIEGDEKDIRRKIYHIAFQQVYDEDTGVVTWKVVDYQFAGDEKYL